jgi:2,4-dienoyl-CoA reductase-like NADH-dependent reductase (Old Yellow Enzyme family)
MAFEAMFEPIQIGKLTIRNRVLSTAHAEVYATDGGMTTERYVQYYEEKPRAVSAWRFVAAPRWWPSTARRSGGVRST